MNSLYTLAHELLTLGMDGSPIYSDHFARLNREVYEQALELYTNPKGDVPEEEAKICLSVLAALNASYYDNGCKQQCIQGILQRCSEVLPLVLDPLLKVRLLTYCYGEVYEEELADEAHAIINAWGESALSSEQIEIIEELKNFEENPYPFEEGE